MSRGATCPPTLDQMGIPRDRASRAMQLGEVPQDQFDAALAEDRIAQPRRVLRETHEPAKPAPLVPIDKTLTLWGKVRDLGSRSASGPSAVTGNSPAYFSC